MEEQQENLPQGWAIATLNDVAQWGSGGTPSRKSPQFYTGSIPWIKTGELGPKRIRSAEEHITEEAILKSSAKVFPAGSVGIAMYGATIGKLSIWAIDASTNQACAVAQPYAGILSNEYLYYFLLSEKRSLIESGKGGAQPNISQGILKDWQISLPPINEQLRIVANIEELFSGLDKGIESLKTAREQLKVYRQAVLKHAFEGKLTAQWREKNTDKLETVDQLLARIKQERDARYQQQLEDWNTAVKAWKANGKPGKKPSRPKRPNSLATISVQEAKTLANLPKGWAHIRLGEIIDEPKYGTSKKCDYDIDGMGVLRIPNVAHGIVDAADLKFAQFDNDEIETYKLKSGDILTIRSNGSVSLVGKCALISESEEHYLFAGYLIRLRPNHQLIAPEYLISVLSGHFLRMQIEGKAKSTSGVNNINSGEIQHLIVPICTIGEQNELMKRLASTLSTIDATESEIDEQILRSESLRQSILKNAFSGQLVAQDPTDEPAAALLERIKAEKAAQTTSNKKNKKSKAAA